MNYSEPPGGVYCTSFHIIHLQLVVTKYPFCKSGSNCNGTEHCSLQYTAATLHIVLYTWTVPKVMRTIFLRSAVGPGKDSGGRGRWRGNPGIQFDFEVSHPRCVLFNTNITMYELVRTQLYLTL